MTDEHQPPAEVLSIRIDYLSEQVKSLRDDVRGIIEKLSGHYATREYVDSKLLVIESGRKPYSMLGNAIITAVTSGLVVALMSLIVKK